MSAGASVLTGRRVIRHEGEEHPQGSLLGKGWWWGMQWAWKVDKGALLGRRDCRQTELHDWGLPAMEDMGFWLGRKGQSPGSCDWSVSSQGNREGLGQSLGLRLGVGRPLHRWPLAGHCTFRRLVQSLNETLYAPWGRWALQLWSDDSRDPES